MSNVHLRIVSQTVYRNLARNHVQFNKNIVFESKRRLLSTVPCENSTTGNAGNVNSRLNLKKIDAVAIIPAAYMAYDYFRRKQEAMNYKEPDIVTVDRMPNVPIDYKIVGPNDKTNVDLILFRCQTCPFCCKMIAYLNSKGLSYSVVSVDEPFERRVKWSHYQQVPCVLARTKDGKYIELTNSTVVISILAALTNDPQLNIEDLARMYPKMSYVKANGVKKHGIVNKYDLMYNGKLPKGVTLESMHEEFRWRDWADHQFVHMVYPNIYLTHDEALETYHWFSQLGKWDQMYPSWMTYLMVHAGATYMFLISKRLKK